MELAELVALIAAIATTAAALAAAVWNLTQSRSHVKQREFAYLTETVKAQHDELEDLRAELRATKVELRQAQRDLKAAECRITELEAENQDLRARLARHRKQTPVSVQAEGESA